MESDSLKTTFPDNDRFDALLRAHLSATAPLADNGFTARVVRALPAHVPSADRVELEHLARELAAETKRRAWFCAAGTLMGLATLYVGNGGGRELALAVQQTLEVLSPEFSFAALDANLPPLSAALAITLGSLVLVYWTESLPRKARR